MRAFRNVVRAFAVAASVLLAGCPDITGGDKVCTTEFRFGIGVTVLDSLTNAPPTSALLIARSGTFVDSIGPIQAQPLVGLVLGTAGERAGVYDLTVRSAGYRDWTKTGVRVTKGTCHVDQTALTARLQKAP